MILDVNNLSCGVPGRVLFSHLSFTVDAGKSLALVGPSGSGKSTLLSAILGMKRVREGTITVCGSTISNVKSTTAAQLRRDHIGAVFQDGELLPELTSAENIAVALMMNQPGNSENRMMQATKILESVNVPPHTRAGNLSGGERQRTALMRALATSPELIIADEPTGSLDTVTRDVVAEFLFSTVRNRNSAMLVVTHDPTIAARADQTLELGDYTF